MIALQNGGTTEVFEVPVDSEYHYWLNRDPAWNGNPNEKILCVSHGSTKPFTEGQSIGVTVKVSMVTCQKCLEWLHA